MYSAGQKAKGSQEGFLALEKSHLWINVKRSCGFVNEREILVCSRKGLFRFSQQSPVMTLLWTVSKLDSL